jgi:fructose-1,6-bisphosphatase I
MDEHLILTQTNNQTVTNFIMSATRDREMAILMNAIQLSCKLITRAVRKAGIANLLGLAGDTNTSGDDMKKLDVLSDEIMVNALINSHCCAVLVSEERDEPIIVPEDKQGRYCVAFDPLDGSSNIDCNVSTGTIFAIYEKLEEGEEACLEDILRPGSHVVAAGYCMYGSATEMVISFGQGVHQFTLDPSIGEFLLTRAEITIPDNGKKIYSINEGNYSKWDEPIQRAVNQFKDPSAGYSLRYVGSMVSDIHRTLLYGGIFMYPADKKSGKGKLRVLYEGFPMAFIIEHAGGVASTGFFEGSIQRILDLDPKSIHDRCPIVMGCHRDVDMVLNCYGEEGKEEES